MAGNNDSLSRLAPNDGNAQSQSDYVQRQRATEFMQEHPAKIGGSDQLDEHDAEEAGGVTLKKSARTASVELDEVLNIQNVVPLYECLRDLLDTHQKIEIDAASVRVIDTSTLQLLVVLKREAAKLGKQVVFDFPSERFLEAAQLLGLSELLEVDHPASGLF